MAARSTTRRRRRSTRRRRVWVKAHCRGRPEASWRKRERVNRSMPF